MRVLKAKVYRFDVYCGIIF